jgi:hypothetical protein
VISIEGGDVDPRTLARCCNPNVADGADPEDAVVVLTAAADDDDDDDDEEEANDVDDDDGDDRLLPRASSFFAGSRCCCCCFCGASGSAAGYLPPAKANSRNMFFLNFSLPSGPNGKISSPVCKSGTGSSIGTTSSSSDVFASAVIALAAVTRC